MKCNCSNIEGRPYEHTRVNIGTGASPDFHDANCALAVYGALEQLDAACNSLMGEVVGKSVTHWGVVNDALCFGAKIRDAMKGTK